MATQILRRLDRWRFEGPMALLLAGAAGFAAMAMPHDLAARIPVAGGYGREGQAATALLIALLCGIAGYVAMRRPARRAAVEPEAEIDIVAEPVEDAVQHPVRVRRADRHPDAPAREPIRASRDLGEPFMEVAPPIAQASDPAVQAPEQPAEDPVVQHDEPLAAEPALVETMADPEAIEAVPTGPVPILLAMPEPVAVPDPAPSLAIAKPATVVTSARFSFAAIGRREDTSLAAMIDRLSDGMKARERSARPLDPPRDRGPALREALTELNRLAVRRG